LARDRCRGKTRNSEALAAARGTLPARIARAPRGSATQRAPVLHRSRRRRPGMRLHASLYRRARATQGSTAAETPGQRPRAGAFRRILARVGAGPAPARAARQVTVL